MSTFSGNANIVIEHPHEIQHFLSLKVMRQSNFLTNKETEKTTQNETLDSKGSSSRIHMRDLSENEYLSSPSISSNANAIDNIYLGATFDSYLIVNNDSTLVARDISIKAELQTSSQRLQLADTNSKPIPTVEPHETCEFVIRHEIKE